MISNEDCHDPTYEVVYDNEQLKPIVIPPLPREDDPLTDDQLWISIAVSQKRVETRCWLIY